MAYTVLARKYRSQGFDEVIGQGPIAQTLKNAIKTGRVSHAYLFAGTRGIGKTTMARILAKALNCLSVSEPTVEPCCKCDSCVAINLGEDIDVIEIDGASNNSVDQVRQLRENAIYRPARARYKIYIIDEVHMLSTSAFNALLKILEEPPSHVKFIFATTEPNKVIPTVQSRCQRFDFANISVKLIAEQLEKILKQEKIKFEKDLLLPLAKMANGSMRDGLSLLDRLLSTGVEPLNAGLLEEYLGKADSEKICNLISQIGDKDAAGTLSAVEVLVGSGTTEVQIVDSLIDYMRDLMVIKSAGEKSELVAMSEQQRKQAGELAGKFDVAGLVYGITTLEKLRWTIKNSETARALLEAALLRFALSEHFLNVDSLMSQLQTGALKKKRQVANNTTADTAAKGVEFENSKLFAAGDEVSLESIKSNWQDILRVIGSELGAGTQGLLSSAVPSRFEEGVLTIGFPAYAEISKKKCESNGRTEAIEAILSRRFARDVRLKFETAGGENIDAETSKEAAGIRRQRENEIINDPAVKTILRELGATITGFEEDRKK